MIRSEEPRMEIKQEIMIAIGSRVGGLYVDGHVESIVAERLWIKLMLEWVGVGEIKMREAISMDRIPIVKMP